MPIARNEFLEGIDKDSDVLRIKTSKARRLRNMRLLNIEGQGWVLTNIEGNEKQFQLSQGFIPLGYEEYGGIAYINSYNINTNEFEMGTYPSPVPGCTGGFLDVYAPLQNFTGPINPIINPLAPRMPFRTNLLNIDCEHQMELVVRIDYDKSVNIYWVDSQKNPLRVVNSGFNQEGVCNDRLYWIGSFPNGIEANNDTCNAIQPTLQSIDPTGQLRAGNWIFYFRYNTLDFNPTSFNGESGPCQIGPDWIPAGITVDGAAGLTVTDKSVTFLLSNLDPSFPYIEVAYVYNYEGLTEVRLIDRLYTNSVTGTTQITITGSESVINFTEADIIRKKISDDIPKTITQLENRLWIANLLERNLFHPDLVAFAKCVIARPDDSLQFDDRPFALSQNFFQYGQYKDHFKTYNSIGYFRGETYAFAIRYVFKSGRLSEPIPVSGYDAWLDPAALFLNDQGILRFPNQGQSPFFTSTNPVTGEGLINVMGVKFDTTGCVPSAWMNDNICGWFFVRCHERNENLLYQGLVLNCYNEVGSGPVQCPLGVNGAPTDVRSPNFIPLWALSFIAGTGTVYPSVDILTGPGTDTVFGENAANQPFRKYGFYSPDHFFKKGINDGGCFIGRFATYAPSHTTISPTHIPSFQTEILNMTFFPIQIGDAVARNIGAWQQADNNGFVSLFPEGSAADADSFYYSQRSCFPASAIEKKNRKFATSRYIGLDLSASANFVNIDAGYTPSCVNIYRNHPITNFVLLSQYIVRNTKYCNISNFISISNFQIVVPGTIYYRGDCFVSREYFKQLYNPDFYPIAQQDSISNFYTFGWLHSMITENSYNVDFRHADVNNTYYPELGLGNAGAFVYDNIKYESELFNEGYNVALGIDCAFGYDSLIPFRGNCYPTRIRYSNQHTQNSFSDGYRIFDLAGYRDYDYRMGPINKIIDFQARLFSIQDSGLNAHFINDRAALAPGTTSQGELLIGTGDVLAQKAQNITDMYGSQHQWSIIKTERAIYGVDWNKRKIWRMGQGFEPISDTKLIRSLMHQVVEQYSDHSDIIHQLVDNPVCREGIVSAYDRKFNDVVFNFIFNQTVREPKISYSLRFNELIDAFTGEYDNISPFMLSLNEDFFTANPQIFPSQLLNPLTTGDFWLEGKAVTSLGVPNKTTFYGTLFSCGVSYVVNGEADMTKVFDNKHINSNNLTPESIDYLTQHQIGVQNPFLTGTNRHIDPVYRENQWRVPIRRADSVINPVNNIYAVGSIMRGTWLQATLEYNTASPIFVKSILTEFRVSKQ